MNTKDTTEIEERKPKLSPKQVEANRKYCREYYQKNKEYLNALKRAKHYKERMQKDTEKVQPIAKPDKPKRVARRTKPTQQPIVEVVLCSNYTLNDIAKKMGISRPKLNPIASNTKYLMPKPLYKRLDGTDIYNKKEIDDWLPYIANVIAFTGKGRKIKITGMAVQIVNFVKANKHIINHCDEERSRLRSLWVNAL